MSGLPSTMCAIALMVSAFAILHVHVEANNSFLGQVSEADVKQGLIDELEAALRDGGQERIEKLEAALRPMFNALPQTPQGTLEHGVARFALHRLFLQRHRWFITGLEPNADVANSTLKEWVPSYLMTTLEKLFGRNSADLRELAVIAATFEDLIHKEAVGRLQEIYQMWNLSTTETIGEDMMGKVITVYLSIYTSGGHAIAKTPKDIKDKGVRLHPKTLEWLKAEKVNRIGSQNEVLDFSAATDTVQLIGERYGSFNDHECREVKSALLNIGDRKTGRVKLSDYYEKGRHGYWRFTEKIDYLRMLGVLDESDPNEPMVIVSNYVSARHNCLAASGFYAICCHNECEDLMGHLESKIAAPKGSPSQIAELVAALP